MRFNRHVAASAPAPDDLHQVSRRHFIVAPLEPASATAVPTATSRDRLDHEPEPVNTELIGTTFVVAINRPEVRNAVNGAVAAALAEAFRSFEENDDAKVAVLAGEGGRSAPGRPARDRHP